MDRYTQTIMIRLFSRNFIIRNICFSKLEVDWDQEVGTCKIVEYVGYLAIIVCRYISKQEVGAVLAENTMIRNKRVCF